MGKAIEKIISEEYLSKEIYVKNIKKPTRK